MWKSAKPASPPTTMQGFNGYCEWMNQDQTMILKDTRDNNNYTIAKLKDGKCWMIENLRLTGSRTLTSSNSDVSSSFTLPASTDSFSKGSSSDPIQINASSASQYGVYYSWYAATAGTGTYSMNSGNAASSICPKGWKLPTGDSGGDFENMAKKYGSGTDSATFTALRATPVPGFLLSGYYVYSSSGDQGRAGN